jgi:hypothetical protein
VAAPITWAYRDPDLWPSIAQASALLLSLAALARLREHLALTVEGPPSRDFSGSARATLTRAGR